MASNIIIGNQATPSGLPVRKKRKGKKYLYFFIFLLLLVGLFWFLFLRPYSEGFRDGYVTKLSKKGVMFKTWEGELIRNQFSAGTSKDIFQFSVADDAVAQKLNTMDQRKYVKLHYKQYFFQIFYRGDTKYFVDQIIEMQDNTLQQVMPNVNIAPTQR
jgi:hypothetical protein